MKQYRIFQNSLGVTDAVKQDWTWPAFFFPWILAFVKRLFVHGAVILVGSILLSVVFSSLLGDSVAADFVGLLVALCVSVVVGVQASVWREQNLLSRGYRFVAAVTADSNESALAMYLAQPRPQVVPRVVAAVPRPHVAVPAARPQNDTATTLQQLKTLYDQQLISADEYEAKRAEVLARL